MNVNEIAMLEERENHLYFDGHDVVKLAEEYGTPLYICSEKRIRQNVKEVQDAFLQYHKNTSIHYASKAETTLATLEVIKDAGACLEVNSGGELYKGLKAGFQGDQIVFNGVAKSGDEIRRALENNIKAIVVDSGYEVEKILCVAKEMGKCANIILRIVPDVASGVQKGVETGTHESKFGIMLEDVEALIGYCAENSKFLNLRGYHFHIGTQTFQLDSFIDSFCVLLKLCLDMKEKTGYLPEILDIGGGLPIPYYIEPTASQYMNPNYYQMLRGTLTTKEIAQAVTQTLHEYDSLLKDCQLVLEPGRKIVGDAFLLMMKVENRKLRRSMNDTWIMVNAGLNVMLEVKTYHWYFPMVCANKINDPHVFPVKIGGPLCESGDVWMDYDGHKDLPDYREMPATISPGDYIAMLETGAYGTSLMNRYNGRPMTGVLMIREDGSLFMARESETYEDLFQGESSLKL